MCHPLESRSREGIRSIKKYKQHFVVHWQWNGWCYRRISVTIILTAAKSENSNVCFVVCFVVGFLQDLGCTSALDPSCDAYLATTMKCMVWWKQWQDACLRFNACVQVSWTANKVSHETVWTYVQDVASASWNFSASQTTKYRASPEIRLLQQNTGEQSWATTYWYFKKTVCVAKAHQD
jgi:hypothetical protein